LQNKLESTAGVQTSANDKHADVSSSHTDISLVHVMFHNSGLSMVVNSTAYIQAISTVRKKTKTKFLDQEKTNKQTVKYIPVFTE